MNTRHFLTLMAPILVVMLFLFMPLSYSTSTTDNMEKSEATNAHQRRLWHFVLRHVSLKDAKWMVDKAKKYGFNSVVVLVTDGVKLDKSPWTPLKGAWSKNEFISWVEYAKSSGMEVIPEVKLLTHQEKFFQKNHPSLMYNSFTYDPRFNQVYDVIFPFLEEIISIIKPKTIHVGHDEAAGLNKRSESTWLIKRKWLGKEEKLIPSDLFLLDILKLHAYLTKKNINTGIWGDMLLSENEFPNMLKRHLHGNKPHYGKTLRHKLPKDIIIFDWHYSDKQKYFPSLKKLQEEGFRVIGSTWKKANTIRNFSNYAFKNNAYGMLAGTWWHVQRKEWDKVDDILKESGHIFLNN